VRQACTKSESFNDASTRRGKASVRKRERVGNAAQAQVGHHADENNGDANVERRHKGQRTENGTRHVALRIFGLARQIGNGVKTNILKKSRDETRINCRVSSYLCGEKSNMRSIPQKGKENLARATKDARPTELADHVRRVGRDERVDIGGLEIGGSGNYKDHQGHNLD
jgi:hypothetical protein